MTDQDVDLKRRRSFSYLLGNLLVSTEEAKGHRHCALSGLESLERAAFEKLIPGIDAQYDLLVSKESLTATNRNTKKTVLLFQLDLATTTAFNLINKRNTIGEITSMFSGKMNWTDEQAYSFVKKLILDLVKLEVCRFSNPTEDDE